MSKRIGFIIVLQILFFTGCRICLFESGNTEYQELRRIPVTEKGERIKKIESYPTDKQIDIFLIAAKCANDPSVTSIFSDISESKIPQIVKRIGIANNEEDRFYLIRALNNIQLKCHCINQSTTDELSRYVIEERWNDGEVQKFYKDGYRSYLEDIINQRNKHLLK